MEDLKQNISHINEKVKSMNLDFDQRYHSSAKKIKTAEKEN